MKIDVSRKSLAVEIEVQGKSARSQADQLNCHELQRIKDKLN